MHPNNFFNEYIDDDVFVIMWMIIHLVSDSPCNIVNLQRLIFVTRDDK